MHIHRQISATLFCWSLGTAGCATNQPAPPLGGTVGLTLAQQILDPGANANRPSVDGIDGQAAKSGYDAYQKTYRAPQPQQNVFTIGVGSR